jgi:hypothetical protein
MSTILFETEPAEKPNLSLKEVRIDGEILDDNMLVALPPEQAQLQLFPIGASVLVIQDAKPFVFGVVQKIFVNLMSRERGNLYTVQGHSGPVFAREADLQFASQTRVWCDNMAALVISSSQDSMLAPVRYTVYIVDGDLLSDVGMDRLKFRMKGENGLTVTQHNTEHSAGYDTKSDPPFGDKKFIPIEEVKRGAETNVPFVIEMLDSDDDGEERSENHDRKKKRPSLATRWEPPSKRDNIQNVKAAITCWTSKARNHEFESETCVYQHIVLPPWVDACKIKGMHLRVKELPKNL